MFSKELIDYTVSTFKESKIDILTGTMVKEIKDKSVVLQMPDKSIKEVPVGMVVWAGGNKARDVSVNLMSRLPDAQKNKRGITVDGIAASHFHKLISDSFEFEFFCDRPPSPGGFGRDYLCSWRLHFFTVCAYGPSCLPARGVSCSLI